MIRNLSASFLQTVVDKSAIISAMVSKMVIDPRIPDNPVVLNRSWKTRLPKNRAFEISGDPRDKLLIWRVVQARKSQRMPLGHLPDVYLIPPEIKEAEVIDFTIQKHRADRAGDHYDIRIIRNGKAYSFATKKEFPKQPNRIIGVFLQPVHSEEYSHWEGDIPKGQYGSGSVQVWDSGKAVIKSSDHTPGGFNVQFFGEKISGQYAFIPGKTNGAWMMLRMKSQPTLPIVPANEYTTEFPEEVWDNQNYVAENKIDGANFTAYVTPRGMSFISRRESVNGHPINRSHNIPHLRDIKLPKKFQGAVIQGELAIAKKGSNGLWIADNELTAGTLNSKPFNAIKSQEQYGKIILFPFEVIKAPGLPRNATYQQRRQYLEELARAADSEYIVLPESRTTNKRSFYETVIDSSAEFNSVKRTGEGIVLKRLDGDHRTRDFVWMKQKSHTDLDLYVNGYTDGEGRLSGRGVGALLVSDRSGRVVGKVGSGLTDEDRIEIYANPQKYLGKVVEVRATEVTKDGNLRGPRLIRWRDDKTKAMVDKI